MSFFMSADYSLSTKVMEIIYFIIGLLCIYCGVKNLKDKENPEPMGTFIFWAVLGVVSSAQQVIAVRPGIKNLLPIPLGRLARALKRSVLPT